MTPPLNAAENVAVSEVYTVILFVEIIREF